MGFQPGERSCCPRCGAFQASSGRCRYCGASLGKEDAAGKAYGPTAILEIWDDLRFRLADVKRRFEDYITDLGAAFHARTGIDLMSKARAARLWFRDIVDFSATILVAFGFSWAVCMFFLYIASGAWGIYLETETGRQFLVHFPQKASLIKDIIGRTPSLLSLDVNLAAAKACLVVAASAQLSRLALLFYHGRGAVAVVFFWPAVCAALSAWFLESDQSIDFQAGFILSVLPALIMANPFFRLAARCLPEADLKWIIGKIVALAKKGWRKTVSLLLPPK